MALTLWKVTLLLYAAVTGAHGFFTAGGLPVLARASGSAPPTARPLCAVSVNKDAFDTVTSVLTLLEGAGPQVKEGISALGGDDKKREEYIRTAAQSVHRSTAALTEAMQGPSRVERDCVADLTRVVELARTDAENPSLMVYGPRGVGKTSMVAAALQNSTGVLNVAIPGDGTDFNFEQRVERVVLQLAGLQVARQRPKADTGTRLRAILAAHERVYSQRAVIVIDVNANVQPAQLSDMLLAAKQLGFEEGLATFVFVMSASRSALGLPIGLQQLRVEGHSAPDFTQEEAQQYIKRRLPDFSGVAANITNLVGDRAMDLVAVCKTCRGATSAEE